MNLLKELKLLLFAILVLLFPQRGIGQDANFSQNYASPLYLSPSFTGLTDGGRIAFNYRDAWPNIPGTYTTMAFSFDYYLSEYNSGVGLLYYRDDQGEGQLVDQNVGLLYSYEIYVSEKIMIRPGIQFKYAQRSIDPERIILGGQLDPDGNPVTGGGVILNTESHNKFDAAASVMVYSNFYWAGLTIDHLVKSNINFRDIETNREMKYTAYAGGKWIYKEGRRGAADQSVSLAMNYRMQGEFNQLDVGAYWMYNPIELGLWYRGIPTKNAAQLSNRDAVIAILGFHIGQLRLAYSYDLTISELAGSSGGSHEFSIIYRIPSSNKPRINRSAMPCSQPGYSGGGPSRSKYRSRSRKIF